MRSHAADLRALREISVQHRKIRARINAKVTCNSVNRSWNAQVPTRDRKCNGRPALFGENRTHRLAHLTAWCDRSPTCFGPHQSRHVARFDPWTRRTEINQLVRQVQNSSESEQFAQSKHTAVITVT